MVRRASKPMRRCSGSSKSLIRCVFFLLLAMHHADADEQLAPRPPRLLAVASELNNDTSVTPPPLPDLQAPTECIRPERNTLTSFCYGACRSQNQLCVNYAPLPVEAEARMGDGDYYYRGCAHTDMDSCMASVGANKCELQCLQMHNEVNDVWVLDVAPPQADRAETSLFVHVEPLLLPRTLQKLRIVGTTERTRKVPLSFEEDALARGHALTQITLLDLELEAMETNVFPSTLETLVIRRTNMVKFDPRSKRPFPSLKHLDLSENKLPDIPAIVFELRELEELMLMQNPMENVHLTAPQLAFLKKLKVFDASLSISGKCRGGYEAVQVDEIGQICYNGKDLMSEKIGSGSQNDATGVEKNESNSTTIVVVVSALVVLVGAVIVFGMFLLKRAKRNVNEQSASMVNLKRPTYSSSSNSLSSDYQQFPDQTEASGVSPIRKATFQHIPVEEIKMLGTSSVHGSVSVNFAEYGKSKVYVSTLQFDEDPLEATDASTTVLPVISQLRHPQMLNILGVVWQDKRTFLAICESMNHATLEEYLLTTAAKLSWSNFKQKAAAEVAECLMYLHSKQKGSYDILNGKTVLVDSQKGCKLNPLIASAPSSLILQNADSSSRVFFAPEIVKGEAPRAASDMYAFGVLLAQLDTCKTPTDMIRDCWRQRSLDNIVVEDPPVHQPSGNAETGTGNPASFMSMFAFSQDCPESVKELAFVCLQIDPSTRPSASYIAATLRQQSS